MVIYCVKIVDCEKKHTFDRTTKKADYTANFCRKGYNLIQPFLSKAYYLKTAPESTAAHRKRAAWLKSIILIIITI